MRQRFLLWYSHFIYERRVAVLSVAVLLTILAGLACLRLELRTSREALSADNPSPAELNYQAFIDEFGTPDELLVVVEAAAEAAPSEAEYRAFVDELAAALGREPRFFSELFYRIDLAAFERHGLHYLPLEDLRQLVEATEEALGSGGALLRLRNVADVNRLIAERIRSGGEAGAGPATVAAAAEGLHRLAAGIEMEARFLEDPAGTTEDLDLVALGRSLTGGQQGISPEGYLTSHSGRHYFLVAKPASASTGLDYINPMIAFVRDSIATVQASHPALKAGMTGLPAMVQEEMAAVRGDTIRTTLFALVGITLLSLLAFHRRRLAPLVMVTLLMGVSWTAALIALSIGYLNLITSSFAAILIGLGIDFGVHIVSQYELEVAHGSGCRDAIAGAVRKTGPGLLASAFTTAAAFFSITLMDFPGFAQLGFIGGWGIVLCLLATFTALPAMLAIEGHRRKQRGERVASLARGDRISRGILRFPAATLAIGAVLTVVLVIQARKITFDQNIQNLLPVNAESLRIQDTVLQESELSPDFSMVLTDDLDELEKLHSSRPELASIGRRESILSYLPRDGAERDPLLARLNGLLAKTAFPDRATETTLPELEDSLDDLEDALAEVEEVAFADGRTDLLEAAGAALDAVEDARNASASASPERVAEWAGSWTRLLQAARQGRDRLGELARQAAPTSEDLPETLRKRLIGRTGKYLLYLYPDGKLAETGARAQFLADSREISSTVTGYPVLVDEGTRRITRSFGRVIWVGAVLSALALLVDFRHLGYALMAASTTALGISWMLGLMGLTGIHFNLANLPTVPLVLGAGVAYGIHFLHRYRMEGHRGLATVLHHTGRAILISALTTMIGFGSMAFAGHRGIASLGKMLLFGIGSCFVCATLLLPCALHLLARRRTENS